MLLLALIVGIFFFGSGGVTSDVPAGVIQGTGHTVGFGELKVYDIIGTLRDFSFQSLHYLSECRRSGGVRSFIYPGPRGLSCLKAS